MYPGRFHYGRIKNHHINSHFRNLGIYLKIRHSFISAIWKKVLIYCSQFYGYLYILHIRYHFLFGFLQVLKFYFYFNNFHRDRITSLPLHCFLSLAPNCPLELFSCLLTLKLIVSSYKLRHLPL